jgi:hypothetical protein
MGVQFKIIPNLEVESFFLDVYQFAGISLQSKQNSFKETGSQGLLDRFETSSQIANFCNSRKFLFSEINLSSIALISRKMSQNFVSCNFRENVTRFYFLCVLSFIYLVYWIFAPSFLLQIFSVISLYSNTCQAIFCEIFDIELNRLEYIFEVLKLMIHTIESI